MKYHNGEGKANNTQTGNSTAQLSFSLHNTWKPEPTGHPTTPFNEAKALALPDQTFGDGWWDGRGGLGGSPLNWYWEHDQAPTPWSSHKYL
jgi:hypothetical protein